MRLSGAHVRRDAASRQEPPGDQAGERGVHAQERGQTRGQTNELGGLDQKNGNGRLPGCDPVHGLVKQRHPRPVLRGPGTAAVRLSVKDRSLGPDREAGQAVRPEATGREAQLQAGLRVAVREHVRRDFGRGPAVIVRGWPSGLPLGAVHREERQFPFDRTQAVAARPAPGRVHRDRMRPDLAPLKG
jgi:hypothetical protein